MTRAGWLMTGIPVLLVTGAAGVYLSGGDSVPESPDRVTEATVTKARAALEANAFRDVIRYTSTVSDEQPRAAELRLWEGIAYWNLDRWQAAEEAWNRALTIDRQIPEAGWRLLRDYQYEQRFAEAEELVLRLYPSEPDEGDRTRLLLELIRQDNERPGPEAIVKTLEPVLANEPNNVDAARAVGTSYMQLGRTREGREMLDRAWRLAPDDPEVRFSRIWFLHESGQIQDLGEACAGLPESLGQQARFLRYRGMWAEAAQRSEDAVEAYRATLAADSADRKAHYQLARLLRTTGNEREAEQHERMARELDEAREELAGRFIRAKQAGFELTGEDCAAFGRLCERLGRTRQARCWSELSVRR
jgi:tetratricopeptide (TPR) repeat protein